jgi:3-carboxy-cis,cis-muconate cycloisomerase
VISHVIDSVLFRDQYGTEEMRRVFDDRHLVQCWMEAEAALARAEAQLGLIPAQAARAISETAGTVTLDLTAIKQGMDIMVHPLMPFITVFAQAVPGDYGQYVHWGATTQDIMDTACVLQLREASDIVMRQLEALIAVLERTGRRHRDTPMAGRTHGQHALPITFGFKLAVLVAELRRHRERLEQLQPRLFVIQLSGAAGTLASLGERGREVQELFARELRLGVPEITWHTARDTFAEFTCVLAMIGATCAKAANEVIQLQKTEIAELEEHNTEQNVGSSTMPQKRNPMMCEIIVALGHILQQQPALAVGCMVHEHERDMSTWQAEWEFLPETAILTSGALEQTRQVFAELTVRPEKMAANLRISGGLINAEAVMMALSPHIGRQRAHDVVGTAARDSFEVGRPFVQALLAQPEVAGSLSQADLEALLEPTTYLGQATEAVDRVLDGRTRMETTSNQ